MAITDFLAKNFFPEGNLQQIKAQSLSPREYNIRATEDQIQNMFGNVLIVSILLNTQLKAMSHNTYQIITN